MFSLACRRREDRLQWAPPTVLTRLPCLRLVSQCLGGAPSKPPRTKLFSQLPLHLESQPSSPAVWSTCARALGPAHLSWSPSCSIVCHQCQLQGMSCRNPSWAPGFCTCSTLCQERLPLASPPGKSPLPEARWAASPSQESSLALLSTYRPRGHWLSTGLHPRLGGSSKGQAWSLSVRAQCPALCRCPQTPAMNTEENGCRLDSKGCKVQAPISSEWKSNAGAFNRPQHRLPATARSLKYK